jgi:tRNA uridine 5-carboxymethylaminomethyl modification enzyme
MVDDLIRMGLEEPYRLFTSRAEYRLLLGVDSVLPRLLPHGRRLGLVSDEDFEAAMRLEQRLQSADRELAACAVTPDVQTRAILLEALGIDVDAPTTLRNILKRNDLDVIRLVPLAPAALSKLTREELDVLASRVRYEGYVARERERVDRLRPLESKRIPEGFVYTGIPGLSHEVVEKCGRRKPRTLGEASRIPGVTPAAMAIISAHVSRLPAASG